MSEEDVADKAEDILKAARVLEALFELQGQERLPKLELLEWQLNELMIRIENHARELGVPC